MKNLFSLDSKLMQSLQTVGDYIIFNILFILCCLPVVTIGAAKTALYQFMFDTMDGRGNNFKRFFKTLTGEFRRITPIFLLRLLISVILSWEIIWVSYSEIPFQQPVVIVLLLTMLISGMLFGTVPMQASIFNATRKEYLKNSIYMAITRPGRAFLVAVMDLLPIILFLVEPAFTAVTMGLLWFFFYFAITADLSARLWRKPFLQYIDNAEANSR